VSYTQYLWHAIWPVDLSPFYPPRAISGAEAAIAGGLLVAITAAAWRFRKREPVVIVGWMWFVVTLLPVIGLIQVGEQAMADRYTYVPLIGVFVIATWLFANEARRRRWPDAVLMTMGTIVVLSYSVVANAQVLTWSDSVHVWQHAVAVNKPSSRIYENLGAALRDEGRLPKPSRATRWR